MTRLTFITSLAICLEANSVFAKAPDPDQSLLWNKFVQIEYFGNSVLALSDHGVALFQWDEEFQTLNEIDHLVLPSYTQSMKLQESALVVRHLNGDLSFIDVYSFESMSLLGRISPLGNYSDFLFVDSELYLSRWFDGIDRYRVLNFDNPEFVENDKSGVLLNQLERDRHYLYAHDMYNGVIRYELGPKLGSSVQKLNVNKRTFRMGVYGNQVFLALNTAGIVVGTFGWDSAYVAAEVTDVSSPDKILAGGGYLVLLNERKISVLDSYTFDSLCAWEISEESICGDLIYESGEWNLILPKKEGGLSKFRLPSSSESAEVLTRPGTINSAVIHNSTLFTGGDGNPLEAYQVENDSLLEPVLLRGENTGVTDLAICGNRLCALYSGEQKVFEFDIENLDAIIGPIDSFSVSIDYASGLNSYELPDNSTQLLTVENKNQIELFAGILGSFESETVWTFDKPFADTKIVGDRLFVTDRFESISAYSIESDYSLTKCSERNLIGTGWAMEVYGNKLFVFTGNILTAFENCLELDTIVRLTSSVLDAEIENDTLYTVGQDGIAKYDLSGGLPALVDKGGLKGSQISVDKGNIATTDGSSINIYFGETIESGGENSVARSGKLQLYENYPEPFNSSTTIQFELPSSAPVEISVYNLLGQRVRVLTDNYLAAGRHSVSWNGKDDFGSDVSSGIYFYRLQAGADAISKKMILVK